MGAMMLSLPISTAFTTLQNRVSTFPQLEAGLFHFLLNGDPCGLQRPGQLVHTHTHARTHSDENTYLVKVMSRCGDMITHMPCFGFLRFQNVDRV